MVLGDFPGWKDFADLPVLFGILCDNPVGSRSNDKRPNIIIFISTASLHSEKGNGIAFLHTRCCCKGRLAEQEASPNWVCGVIFVPENIWQNIFTQPGTAPDAHVNGDR